MPLIKAITIHQPYASLIAWGEKRYETRSWSTPYRGPIAIHAGKSMEVLEDFAERIAPWIGRKPTPEESAKRREWDAFEYWTLKVMQAHIVPGFTITDFPRGSIVAIGELTNVYHTESKFVDDLTEQESALGYFAYGRFAWQIDNVIELYKPIVARGQQGLWDWNNQNG